MSWLKRSWTRFKDAFLAFFRTNWRLIVGLFVGVAGLATAAYAMDVMILGAPLAPWWAYFLGLSTFFLIMCLAFTAFTWIEHSLWSIGPMGRARTAPAVS